MRLDKLDGTPGPWIRVRLDEGSQVACLMNAAFVRFAIAAGCMSPKCELAQGLALTNDADSSIGLVQYVTDLTLRAKPFSNLKANPLSDGKDAAGPLIKMNAVLLEEDKDAQPHLTAGVAFWLRFQGVQFGTTIMTVKNQEGQKGWVSTEAVELDETEIKSHDKIRELENQECSREELVLNLHKELYK
jgi:hypothetical protein